MGILSWLRNALSGPPSIDYGRGDEGAEAEAAIDDEMSVAAEDEASLKRVEAPESIRHNEPDPGIAAFEDAEDAAPDSTS
jgi:hypothetical protein